jgi:energy-coupling factor transport system permease protein
MIPENASTVVRYHALTLAGYPMLLVLLGVLTQHPLFLVVLLAAAIAALLRVGGFGVLRAMLRYVWPLLILIVLINVLVNKDGATVLWEGPVVPLLGRLRITLESALFAVVMTVRMLVVLAASALYIAWLSPDRALSLAARFAKRSAVTAMMTARLVPYLKEQSDNIGDVMQTRGVRFAQGSWRERLAARRPMLGVLLTSALEGSWQVAEAMEARGFGQGRRTSYQRESWSRRDGMAWLAMTLALLLAVWAAMEGVSGYLYFPRLDGMLAGGTEQEGVLLALMVLLLLPTLFAKRRRRK